MSATTRGWNRTWTAEEFLATDQHEFAAGEWLFSPINGLDAMLRLESMDLAIPLAEIYRTVSVPE